LAQYTERHPLHYQIVFNTIIAAYTKQDYDEATTYHDGKWLLLNVNRDKMVDDLERLLSVKRRPKKTIQE